jgi:hypothetical protein
MSFVQIHDIPLLGGPAPLVHLLLRHVVRSGDRADALNVISARKGA